VDDYGISIAYGSSEHDEVGSLLDLLADVEHVVHSHVWFGHELCADRRMGWDANDLRCCGNFELACIHAVGHEYNGNFVCDYGGGDRNYLRGAGRFRDSDGSYESSSHDNLRTDEQLGRNADDHAGKYVLLAAVRRGREIH